ncbi:MAG TPA: TonB-dependent receptor [Bacteroidales bacterium]|nr:TonB-dependent receptor [Bacteroidales bacterium]HPS17788.1 TonB-dependent receptor [Bacteroidales bacterium]
MKILKKYLFFLNVVLFPFYLHSQDIKDTVKLKSIEIKDSLIKKYSYIASDISKTQIQNSNTHDIGEFLRTVPNVSGLRKGGIAVDPVIRGFRYSELNVVLDNGIKIENGCPNRMDPVSSHVEADDIEKIEIIKGPYTLRYGSSLGGVLNFVTIKPQKYDEFEIHANAMYGFETNWNGQKEHISVFGGYKKIYFLFSGGYKNYGNYESGNLDDLDTTYNSSFEKYNYMGKVGFILTPNQNILFSYSNIRSNDVLYPALPMDEVSDNTQIGSIDYSLKNIGNIIKTFDIKIYRSDVNHIMDNSKRSNYSTKQMIAEVDAINTGGRAELNLQLNKHKIIAGLDFEDIAKDGERIMTMQMMGTSSTKKTNLWNDALIQNSGLYAEYTTSFSSYEINASIRCDYNKATSKDTLKLVKDAIEYFDDVSSQSLNLSANAGITKKINDHLSISLALCRGVRTPNMLERYIKLLAVGYDNYDYLGNPRLKPEINYEADLTLKYSKENLGAVYLNGFYSYVTDYISSVRIPPSIITSQTQGVLGVKQFANTDHVTFEGFELGYTSPEQFRLNTSIVAAYTYGVIPEDIKYITSGTQVIGETTVINDALPEIPPFETTLGISYKFVKRNITPKISIRIVADQRHTSVALYESYTPGFALLNFSVKCKINKFADINAGINNIFDRAYYEHLNRKIVGSTGKLYEPGRVFFINLYVNI